jgi:hypothetical protein
MRGKQQAISDALADIRQSLAVDGYQLGVEAATASDLRVRITALPGACEECLAPAEVIKMIISGGICGSYAPGEIDLVMPEDRH